MRTIGSARLCFVLAGAVLGIHSDLLARAKWLRAATDDVYIISDASPKAVSEYVVKYSAFRRAFIELLAPAGHRPPPVILLLFRDQSELTDYLAKSKGASDIVAYSAEVDNNALLALTDSGDREAALSLAFEFDTIWSLRRAGYFLPLWMAQGTGEVIASLRIKKDHCVIDGELGRVETTWRERTALAWPRFFEIGTTSPEYMGKQANGIYQAQAWALMNLILLREGSPRQQFERLAKTIQETHRDQEAVEAMLGAPAAKFETVIARQLRENHPRSIPFDESAILAHLKIEPADQSEVDVRLGDLLIANGREREGDAAVDRAVARSPQAICVNEALARRELRRDESAAAAKYYRLAMAAGSVNPNAWLTSATEHLNQSQAFGSDYAGSGGANVITAIEEIQHTLGLDPGDMRAWRLLGRAYFVAKDAHEEGIAELSRAVTGEAEGIHVRYYRGLLYSRLGKNAEAHADLAQVIGDTRTPSSLRSFAASYKAHLQLEEDRPAIQQLVREGHYAEARVVAERGVEQARNTGAADAQYQVLRSWVDESEAWANAVGLYNRKEWSAALAAGREFEEKFPRSPFGRDARRLEKSAEENAKRREKASTPPPLSDPAEQNKH